MKYVVGASIITESQVLDNYVLGFDESFCSIIPADEFEREGKETINAEGLYVAPGFIDVHIHGSGGADTMEGTREALIKISETAAKNGVTSFLATTMSMGKGDICKALSNIKDCIGGELPGAELLGAHMEGPFLNTQFKGAQKSEHICIPDWNLVEQFKDIIKIVTIAPEVEGALEMIKKLKDNNIIASMGHTGASFEEAMEGIEAGISHCTHLFNAMSGVHHRNPGVAAAALASDVNCELIADKIHVHPGNFELIRKAKGADQIVLITDCIEAGGMAEGEYSLGGQKVFVKDGSARLSDGVLAGSVLNLNQGVYNFYQHTKIELHEAFKMASLTPAKELKIADRKGSIALGKDADFSLMDHEFNVKATFVKGKNVFLKVE